MRKIATAISLSLLLAATVATAQEPKKPLSPPAKASVTAKGKTITIDYSAPSKRGREIIGGLVPFGEVWRTGANAATTLTTPVELMIGKLRVPAGKYTLYTIPGKDEWTLIVNKQTGQWGTSYDETQDLGRVKMDVDEVKETVETFKISIDEKRLAMTWENTKAWVPVMIH